MRSKSKPATQIFGAKTSLRNAVVSFSALIIFFAVFFWLAGLAALALFANGPPERALNNPLQPTIPFSPPVGDPAPATSAPLQAELVPIPKGLKKVADCSGSKSDTSKSPFSEVYAYIETDFEWISLSIEEACGAFDVAMPVFFEIDNYGFRDVDNNLNPLENEDSIISEYSGQFKVLPVAVVYTFGDDLNSKSASSEYKAKIIKEIGESIRPLGTSGLCIDATQLQTNQIADIVDVLNRARENSGGRMFSSCLIIGTGMLDWLDPISVEAVDKIVVKAFLDPQESLSPRPLASNNWFNVTTNKAVDIIGNEKLVLLLGAGGGAWSTSAKGGEKIGYIDMLHRVRTHTGSVSFQREEGNARAEWIDHFDQLHSAWYLEASDTFNQLIQVAQSGVKRVGIWGLGLEDPSIWSVFRQQELSVSEAKNALENIDISNHVRYSGKGPFMRFSSAGVAGHRVLEVDEDLGRFTDIEYDRLPSPYGVNRWGSPQKNLLAFTFDDGPDPVFTGQILDELSKLSVRATFFPVGQQMLSQRALIRRIHQEGHLIGSHTFFHPDLGKISETRATIEMNLHSRLMANIVGKEPVLFRAPYISGFGPSKGSEAKIMRRINSRGFIMAGSDIVPPDWDMESADAIADFIIGDVVAGNGNVILLHDGGGDRAATVESLPRIVTELRNRGYKFVDLAELIGVTQGDLMPEESGMIWSIESIAITIAVVCLNSIKYIFWIAIGCGVLRSVSVLSIAIWRGRQSSEASDYNPSVTVVVPAFNEEKVILRTIETILQSNYNNFEVLVINDGSNDKTHALVKKTYKENPKVRLLHQQNQGKWQASNNAYRHADSEIVVAVDADTLVDPDAIKFLVQKLSDPEVAAVAGNVKVGNTNNVITRLQAIEYITAQNIDRRALEAFNAMMVVPGAIGAWRTEAVKKVGFYSPDTLTEDADLTITLIRNGYKVTFDERAYTYTEAPETVRAFLTQRLRWTLGMMQTGWKHRHAITERRAVGMISLLDLFVFGTILPLLAPLIDVILLVTLFGVLADVFSGTTAERTMSNKLILMGYFALPALELVVAATAIWFEKTERYSILLYMPLQRIFVKQLLTFTVYKSIWRALTGRLANWNKLKRTASVTLAPILPKRSKPQVIAQKSGNPARSAPL